jgi:hypothetical protein
MSTDAGNVGFAPDLVITKKRQLTGGATFMDRLRGNNIALLSSGTAAESTVTSVGVQFNSDTNVGVDINGGAGTSSWTACCFKRAPGFMDVVCYSGTGAVLNVTHNLGVVPEMIIIKGRDIAYLWQVYHKDAGTQSYPAQYGIVSLNTTDAYGTATGYWNTTTPTSSTFTLGASIFANTSAKQYVAYLFATLAGISKVGSYTGNGSSQTINCGFAAGARFILIKRTDAAGDWYVWNTAIGIVAGNDSHISLNTTNSQVIGDDSIDPDNTGFIVNQVAATNINVTSATYIFLAIA